MVCLSVLVVANLAFIGLGFSSQSSDALPAALALEPAPVPRLRLVSEMAGPPAPEAVQRPLICRAFGPYSDTQSLDELKARVRSAGGQLEVRETRVDNPPDYLVFVGERGKAENARRVLRELESQAIDSMLITRGPYNNTLSVGVFSRPDRARLQQGRVAELGYDVGIEEIDRSYVLFRVEARVPEGFRVDDERGEPCAEIAQAH